MFPCSKRLEFQWLLTRNAIKTISANTRTARSLRFRYPIRKLQSGLGTSRKCSDVLSWLGTSTDARYLSHRWDVQRIRDDWPHSPLQHGEARFPMPRNKQKSCTSVGARSLKEFRVSTRQKPTAEHLDKILRTTVLYCIRSSSIFVWNILCRREFLKKFNPWVPSAHVRPCLYKNNSIQVSKFSQGP